MSNEHSYPIIDDGEIRLRACAEKMGHLKLATWGDKADLLAWLKTGFDKFRLIAN